MSDKPKIYFVLHNIRSAWNVGSIFRSADALGFGLVLIGYTPRPVGANLPLIKKTAIGAENTVPWTFAEHWQEVIASRQGLHIGIEISDKSISVFEYLSKNTINTEQDIYLWLGNEIHGLDVELQDSLSQVLHLDMEGMKESLNVANCMCTVGYLWKYQLWHQTIKSNIS